MCMIPSIETHIRINLINQPNIDIICKHLWQWNIGSGERFQMMQTPFAQTKQSITIIRLHLCIKDIWKPTFCTLNSILHIGCSMYSKTLLYRKIVNFHLLYLFNTHTFTFTYNSSISVSCQIALKSILFFLRQFHFVHSFEKLLPIKGLSELN